MRVLAILLALAAAAVAADRPMPLKSGVEFTG